MMDRKAVKGTIKELTRAASRVDDLRVAHPDPVVEALAYAAGFALNQTLNLLARIEHRIKVVEAT